MTQIQDTFFWKEYKCGTRTRTNAQSSDLEDWEEEDERVERGDDGHLVLHLDEECNEFHCEECN